VNVKIAEPTAAAGAAGDAARADGAAEKAQGPGAREDLGWGLATVLRAYLKTADLVLADMPGGTRGYRLLSSVARDCPTNQVMLGQLVGLDRTVVTYLLDDLVAAGLVERTTDQTDRRVRRIVATDAGVSRLAGADSTLHEVEQQLLGGLTAQERSAFRSLLNRVAVRIAREGADNLTCTNVEQLR
jgi:DNA-binding MarR family transcriptional regulator